jgi:hypothetical protein
MELIYIKYGEMCVTHSAHERNEKCTQRYEPKGRGFEVRIGEYIFKFI